MKRMFEVEIIRRTVIIREGDRTVGAGTPRAATRGLKQYLDSIVLKELANE